MATTSFKKNFVIKDKDTLKRLSKAFDKASKLNAKAINWKEEKARGDSLLKRLLSHSKK